MSWQTKEGNLMITGIPDVGSWVVLDGCVCKVTGVEDKNTVEVDELFHLRYQHVAVDMIGRYATEEEVNLE
ncbi:hypothetical protein, partial [Bacillus mycoides]|uniref:hypothetical protein n=1 Tax=Bacillus mycoides TaxID=1405 RepID=UPI003A80E063